MVAHSFICSTQEANAARFLWVQGQLSLHRSYRTTKAVTVFKKNVACKNM